MSPIDCIRVLIIIIIMSLLIRLFGESAYKLLFKPLHDEPIRLAMITNKTLISKFLMLAFAYLAVIISISFPITSIITFITIEGNPELPVDPKQIQDYMLATVVIGIFAAVIARILIVTLNEKFHGLSSAMFYQIVIIVGAFLLFTRPIGPLELTKKDVIGPVLGAARDFVGGSMLLGISAILFISIIVGEFILRDHLSPDS